MSIIEILYCLTIKPLEIFFEVVYMLAYRVIGSPSLAIIALSLAMNFLVLPLYRRADAMQEEERKTEERLGAGVAHIKKAFKGDERMMILQTYYRQNHYKQSYVLRGSLPLLLEVPFFIAAYRFLSSLQLLQGVSFGPIADLGAPDALIVIGGITVNVLPILMTLVNIISSSIYADHMSRKTKIQLYVMAVIFLVFLYQSPAGLVFYWTLNNLFSLVKNIFYKLPHPRKVLRMFAIVIGGVAAGYCGLVYETPSILRKLVLVGGSALLILIPIAQIVLERSAARKARTQTAVAADVNVATANSVSGNVATSDATADQRDHKTVSTNAVFLSAIIYLTILVGGLIPSAVISASPLDFVSYGLFCDPMDCVVVALALAIGIFIVWCGLFYGLAGSSRKTQMAWILLVAAIVATVNYMVFQPLSKSGNLSSTLVYDHGWIIDTHIALLDLLADLFVLVVIILTSKRFARAWKTLVQLMTVVILIMTVINVIEIRQTIDKFKARKDFQYAYYDELELPLSQDGQNVVVIMLDRAIGSYVPYMLNEKPELIDLFDGFTYYPNTLSYGGHTNFGVPAILGGYDYTPLEINKRSGETLAEKHHEALMSMPLLFAEEGYEVTVCDPPYAGYEWESDLTVYDEYPQINAIRTEGNMNPYQNVQEEERFKVRKRNLFCYSMVRCMPQVIQKALYNEGQYNSSPVESENPYETTYTTDYETTSKGYDVSFMDSYLVLQNLSSITQTSDSKSGSYIFIDNNIVHDPVVVQEPDYTPQYEVDNTQYDAEHQDRFTVDGMTADMSDSSCMRHYESMMAALLQLGNWFDYLRENDLYDNTRIILVSDHAFYLSSFKDRILEDGTDTMAYNPLLMVKDYNASGFTTSEEFMTNADVPYLSVQGLIENPTNPLTGKAITNDAKYDLQYVLESNIADIRQNNGNQFKAGKWLTVHDDVRNASNWQIVSEESVMPDGDD